MHAVCIAGEYILRDVCGRQKYPNALLGVYVRTALKFICTQRSTQNVLGGSAKKHSSFARAGEIVKLRCIRYNKELLLSNAYTYKAK